MLDNGGRNCKGSNKHLQFYHSIFWSQQVRLGLRIRSAWPSSHEGGAGRSSVAAALKEMFDVYTRCQKLELWLMFAGQGRGVAKGWHAALKQVPWWRLCNSQSSNTICPTSVDIGRRGCIATRKIPHRESATTGRSQVMAKDGNLVLIDILIVQAYLIAA